MNVDNLNNFTRGLIDLVIAVFLDVLVLIFRSILSSLVPAVSDLVLEDLVSVGALIGGDQSIVLSLLSMLIYNGVTHR